MALSSSRPHATAVLFDDEQDILRSAAPTRAAFAPTFKQARPLVVVRGLLRLGAVVVGDLLGVAAIVLCVPFVIVAIGTPIALLVRLLLWIGGLL
jgi:hypothetical protein